MELVSLKHQSLEKFRWFYRSVGLSAMPSLSFLALVLSSTSQAAGLYKRANTSTLWNLDQFSNFLVFGDSYTDENRLNYFASRC